MEFARLTIWCGTKDNKDMIHNILGSLINDSKKYNIDNNIDRLIIQCDEYENLDRLLNFISDNLININPLLYVEYGDPIFLLITCYASEDFYCYQFRLDDELLKKLIFINGGLGVTIG